MIRLTTLGGASITRNGREHEALTARKQQFALLAYLALEGPATRDRLLLLFWADRPEEKARHSLSQALYAIRNELGEECLSAVGDRVGLASETVAADARELEEAAAEEDWETVVDLYGGPFLDGFYLSDAPEFEEWAGRTRTRLARIARRAFSEIIQARLEGGNTAEALRVAWRWASLDPLEDEAQHTLIALLAETGDRTGALRQFELYRERMARELEVEPLEETQELIERVRAGELPGRHPDQSAAPPVPPASPSPGEDDQPSVIDAALQLVPPDPAALDLAVKAELAPQLQVLRVLGRGSMASVYLARDVELKRLVAVKVFAPRVGRERRARARFEREAQAIAALTHPNIVTVHWVGTLSSGLPYLVMQYVKGRTLGERLQAQDAVPLPEARRALQALASALAEAHHKGILHRDLRPNNVLYDEESGRYLLSDFGFAAVRARGDVDPPARITESGELVGDPGYRSPEELMGESATELSDVYGFGLVAFEILAGRKPYEGSSRRETFVARLRQEPTKLSGLRPDVDPELESLVERCLAREPRHRPSAADVASALEASAPGGGPVGARRSPTTTDLLSKLTERYIPHVMVVYIATGFGVLELVDQLVGNDVMPGFAYHLALVSYVTGLPAVLIGAWFHGKKGRQEFQPVEYWLFGALGLIWLAVSAVIVIKWVLR